MKLLGPAAQFLHSCICEGFIYFHDRSAYFALRLRTDRGDILDSTMNVNILASASVSFRPTTVQVQNSALT
jgi:hypothetical protein